MSEVPVVDLEALGVEQSLRRVAQLLPWALALTAGTVLMLTLNPPPPDLAEAVILGPPAARIAPGVLHFSWKEMYWLERGTQLLFLGWGSAAWIAARAVLSSGRGRSPVLGAIHVLLLLQCTAVSMLESLRGPGLFGIALGCFVVPGFLAITPWRYRITTGIFLFGTLTLVRLMVGDQLAFNFFTGKAVALAILAMLLQDHLHKAQSKIHGRLEDLHARNTELHHNASCDPLTGLANRRAFGVAFRSGWERAREKGQVLSLISADLDFFKKINDTMGHDFGDKVLREVGRHFLTPVRKSDLVARMGGEEFLLFLPGANAATATAIAERLRAGLASLACAREYDAPITASFGIASSDEVQTPEQLLRLADQRLYAAKRDGRDRVVAQTSLLPLKSRRP